MLIIEFIYGRNKFPCRLAVIRQKYTLSLPSVCAAYRYVRIFPTEALNKVHLQEADLRSAVQAGVSSLAV